MSPERGHHDHADGHGHGHGHGHDQLDWGAMAGRLRSWDELEQGRYREIVTWLGVSPGDTVADVGSGAGGMGAALADAVGSAGTVVLVDGDERLLELAGEVAGRPDHRLLAVHADLETVRLADVVAPRVDLAHATGVIHHLDDQVDAIRNLAGMVKPGGRVAIGEGGLGSRFLPADCGIGEPGLESRLAVAQDAWFWQEVRPGHGTVRAAQGWGPLLAAAGLVDVTERSFLLDVPPPLPPAVRSAVRAVLAAQLEHFGDLLEADDRAALARLVDETAPDGVLRRPDVFVLGVRTIHVGTVPGT